MEWKLRRHEPIDLVARLEAHIATCRACRNRVRSRVEPTHCHIGVAMHETLVRETQANAAVRTRPWWEKLDLREVDSEKRMQEYLRQGEHEAGLLERARRRLGGGTAVTEGIDTSIWQGAFPWWEAVGQGVQSGIAKSSEGNGYTDPQWGRSVAWLLGQTALVGGSYHFARPDLGNTAAGEVAWYLSRHPTACFEPRVPWIFSLDAESSGGTADYCFQFLHGVSLHTGYACWFYSYGNWIQSRQVVAHESPLWLAWPDANGGLPSLGWPVTTQQQYGLRTFSSGQVDANRFFGGRDTLLALAGLGGAIPKPATTQGGFVMGSSMGAFSFNGATHLFELAPTGDVLWARTTGGPGGHVHANPTWNLGGSGPGKPVDMAVWPDGPNYITIRLKYEDGGVLEKVVLADQARPTDFAFDWYAPDAAGAFLVVAGPKGEKGDPGERGEPGADGVVDQTGLVTKLQFDSHAHEGRPTGIPVG